MRADCLDGALAAHVPMPNLRALMADAVTFREHYSVTSPCGPARASLLTGQYAMNHRSVRNGTPLPHDKPNIATEARKAGYLPLLYGYSDTGMDPRMFAPGDPVLHSYEQVMPGFAEALEMRLEESWPWRAHLLSRGYDVPPYPDIFRPVGDSPDSPALYRAEDSDTAFLTDQVITALKARPAGWFATVTYIRPHPPLVAPEPWNRIVDPASLPKPATLLDNDPHPLLPVARMAKPFASNVEGFPELAETDENIAMLRAIYLGLAAEVDHHIGRLIAFLKDEGIYDDTLIVFTGDHGEMLGDFGLWGKSSFHDAAYRVPMMIRDPQRPGSFGTVIAEPTESVDVAPTILDMIGCDIPDTMDGSSLLPFLAGSKPDGWRRYTFSELDFGDPVSPTLLQRTLGIASDSANLAVLRGESHTLVHINGGFPPLLFDRKADGEARNIAGDPECRDILLSMSQAMLDHRMTHAEGRFSHTMITAKGAVRGAY